MTYNFLQFLIFSYNLGLLLAKGNMSWNTNVPHKAIGFIQAWFPFRYLGLPLSIKPLTYKACYSLIDKVQQVINGLAARRLSYAGKKTLIQTILYGVIRLWSSVFILPRSYCECDWICVADFCVVAVVSSRKWRL